MCKIYSLLSALFFNALLFAQITPNFNSGTTTTAYTNGATNDPIFIWCSNGLATQAGSLTATPTGGVGPWTFEWYYHNQLNSSWTSLSSSVGNTSTLNNLPSDGYRVQIYDNGGNLISCDIVWVWNMNGTVSANNNPTACNATGLSGTVSSNGSFSYYNPPPPESIISSNTHITVCFSANHTFVSDLAFYLVGPVSCGSPTILLSPNPGANGQNSVCNSGDNVNNLCFTNQAGSNLNVCTSGTPLTGTYSSYGTGNTAINWSGLNGCNAAQGGWRVQIYDCIGADVGSLTNANISFSNLTSVCGSPTTINYTSGAINSAINDNSCTAASASIFQVPVSNSLLTPIVVNASTSYLWTSNPIVSIPNSSSSLVPSVTGIPDGNTMFYLTATVSYNGISCSYIDSTGFANTCCSAVSNAGTDVSFCQGFNAQIGTPAISGLNYSWSPTTGLNNPSIAQPIVTLTNIGATPQTTVYTLTVTNPAEGNCSVTDQVSVTVNPLPIVSAGTYADRCQNDVDVNLIGSPTGGVFSGIGVSGNMFDPSVGTQSITYSYSNGNGCSNTGIAVIIVNQMPTVNAGASQSVCEDVSSVNLVGTPAGGVFSGTGVIGTTFSTSQGTQLITYNYIDGNGCSGSAQTTISVNPLPSIYAGADQTVCTGSTILLSGNGGVSYAWNNGITNGQPFLPASGNTTYTVIGTDANGCSNSDQVTITGVLMPNAVISSNVTSGEVPLTVVFYNSSTNSTNYYWDFGNGQTVNGTTNSNQTIVYDNVGDYYVMLVATNSICQDSATIHIKVIPFLPPSINIPNVFSPNHDGTNEVFFLTGENILTLELIIFNRWGEFMHQLNNMTDSWNGTTKNGNEADDGVYFYRYRATGLSGDILEGQGNITLIR